MANSTLTVPSPLALIPYAERFIEGRRVVIFGDASTYLAEGVLERGARSVHVYDPDGSRAAQAAATAQKGLTFSGYRSGDTNPREGSFEICIIPDLGRFPDPLALLTQARRSCAAGAILLAATPRVEDEDASEHPSLLNYYSFYTAVRKHFRAVKMVGQVPFQGYALVDFSAGDLEISVDASLTDAEDREPIAYLAIASDHRLAIDPYAIVQLPTELEAEPVAPADAPTALEVRQAVEVQRQAEARLSEEQRRNVELSRALAEAGALPRQLEMRLAEEAHRAEKLANQIQRTQENSERFLRENRALQEHLQQSARGLAEANAERVRFAQREEALQRRLREMEAIPRGVDPAKVDALRQHMEDLESANSALRYQISEMEGYRETAQRQLNELRTQSSAVQRQNQEHRQRLEVALRQIAEQESQLQQQQQQVAALQEQARRAASQAAEEQREHVTDLSTAEATLQERAREIAALRLEVDRRGGMVRELLQALEARNALPLGPQADSEHLAHLERELAAARAQIHQVSSLAVQRESELKLAKEQSARQQQESQALLAAQEEILALRTALQQEHAARAAAEATQGEQNVPEALLKVQQEQNPLG